MIKTLMVSFIISLFLITSLRIINQSIEDVFNNANHSKAINEIDKTSFQDPEEEGFKIIIGQGDTITCKPKLINNYAGRVCVAS